MKNNKCDDQYEDDYESEEEDVEIFWDTLLTSEFCCKLIVVMIVSIIIGLYTAQQLAIAYSPKRYQSLPGPPRDVAIRTDELKTKGEITIMWEPAIEGLVEYYRIYRWNELLRNWVELTHSPTKKLGTKDKYLPYGLDNTTKVRYQVVAENYQNQSMPVEVWFLLGSKGEISFDEPTTSRSLPAPVGIKVEDLSFYEGEERIHIEWNKMEEKPLGYQIFRWNKITKLYDLVDRYDSIRHHTRCQMSKYPTSELYCFVVKAIKWGDIGISPPSLRRCIFVEEWLYAKNRTQNKFEPLT